MWPQLEEIDISYCYFPQEGARTKTTKHRIYYSQLFLRCGDMSCPEHRINTIRSLSLWVLKNNVNIKHSTIISQQENIIQMKIGEINKSFVFLLPPLTLYH